MPHVSVVMAVRNGAATVLRSVNSILGQTYSDFEFIIADDHSTDNTPQIIQGINDDRIQLIKESIKGLVPALNACLKHAKGKFIVRMDVDDISYPNRIKQQVDVLTKESEIGVVSGLVRHIPTQSNQEGYARHVHWLNEIKTPAQHYNNRFMDSPIANPSAMFRASLVDSYGSYLDFDGPEDYDFWLRLLHKKVKFKKINQHVLDWYDYDSRLTRNNSNYSEEAFLKTKAKYFALWWKESGLKLNRRLLVWGYGKEVFNKSKWLELYGLKIEGYIDLKERPLAKRNVLTYNQINKDLHFVLIYVGDRTGQKNIASWLTHNNFEASRDYYFMT